MKARMSQRGMTLIDIIFVVAVIAVVMNVVASNLGERADKAKASATCDALRIDDIESKRRSK
jgi:type II secretory pathway pseudopilin PulG